MCLYLETIPNLWRATSIYDKDVSHNIKLCGDSFGDFLYMSFGLHDAIILVIYIYHFMLYKQYINFVSNDFSLMHYVL